MERFAGLDLHRVREIYGTPEPESILPYIEKIARALGYAHSKNIIHRDIKPRNLMSAKGDGRVLDFGVAAILDPDGTRLTKTGGSWVGDGFSAPELAENPRLFDQRCDVYSLGACWFWLLTGRHPKGLGLEATLRGAMKVSSDYERVLLRCLNQADSRYASMDELIEAIQALRSGNPPQIGSSDMPTDNDLLMLGVVASLCPTSGDSTSFYFIEQELRGAMSRLAMRNTLQRLPRFKLIDVQTEYDINSTGRSEFKLTSAGAEWVEIHEERIALLMKSAMPAETPASTGNFESDDGIPF